MLPEIIDNSIDVEEHADYKKKNGIRSIENGIADNNIIIHRLYGAIRIDGDIYRVKTTIYEQYKGSNVPHDYKVTKIELAISGSSTSDALTNSIETESSVSGAKLLNNIEKSYDKNVKLLDAGVMGTGTLVRYLSRISGTCPYDSSNKKCHCHFVILSRISIF